MIETQQSAGMGPAKLAEEIEWYFVFCHRGARQALETAAAVSLSSGLLSLARLGWFGFTHYANQLQQ